MINKMLMVALNAKYSHTSLALRSIYKYVTSKGDYPIEYMEATINDEYLTILNEILKRTPDMIGFSCYIWNIELVYKLVADIKSINGEIKIFLGGPEVTYNENIFSETNQIDFVIRGEGEIPILKLLQGEEQVQGIWYKGIKSELAQVLPLDDIPFVYTLEELSELQNKAIYYETSRGCPFHCAFCISSLSKGVRIVSLERVFQEIALFIKAKIRKVKLVDRTFNFDQERAYKIIEYIIKNTEDTCFHFEIGADLLNEKLLSLILTAKENQIQFEAGIQSTNEETLEAVDRKTDINKLKKNILGLQNAKVRLHLDLIAGLPKEDFESFRNSFNEAYSLKPDILQLGFLKLLHGSKIRKEKEKYHYQARNSPPYEVLSNDFISFFELMMLKTVEEAVDAYHNSRLFQHSLHYLFEKNETEPFLFFKQLGTKMGKEKLSLKDKFHLLYAVYSHNHFVNQEEFLECLKFDYVLKQRGPLPSIFQNYKNKEIFNHFTEFLENENNRNQYFKECSDIKKKEIMKYLDLEIFKFQNEFKVFVFDRKNNFYIDLSDKIVYHYKVNN